MREPDRTAATLLAVGRAARWRQTARFWLPGVIGASPALLAALACARDGSVLGALALARLAYTLAILIVCPTALRPRMLFEVAADPTALRPTALRPRWRGRPLGSLPHGAGYGGPTPWARIRAALGRCSDRGRRLHARRPAPPR
jgi:hypothetical protein